ncbi:MAG TPA: DUF3828 domain-containing protein [Pyrinomonadaceae bacterium]|jgi:uncharacterized protein DUF3828|nr:DUF3828 domain-containing protein [Pyrinomonadaceae bacterium]
MRLKSFLLAVIAVAVFVSMPARAQQSPSPGDTARGFYTWYLHQLTLENSNPLKQKTTALKYLTPQLYANAPRLIRSMDADIFICAQDWDNGWEKNFSVSTPQIKNSSATATVTLPSGETDKIKIDLTLIKTASGWRISKVACAN